MKKFFVAAMGVAVIVMLSPSAFADLVYTPGITLSGTGLGAVNTITTAHETTGPTEGQPNLYETGCVTASAGLTAQVGTCPSGFSPVDANTDEIAQNHLVPFSVFQNTVNGGDLALVFNIAETGQDLSVNLQNMFLELASSSGSTMFFYLAPAQQGITLTLGSGTGTGQSSFGFSLSAAEAVLATAFTTANCGAGNTCDIGGGFTANNTNDGNETLFVISTNKSNAIVPEPSSIMLLGSLLVGIATWRRKLAASH